ncbi:MAG: DUF1579 domain-containing protein [Pirellulales bacterium]|nr:DUF1579 domain-containing protein [Pirellulales bacterium]
MSHKKLFAPVLLAAVGLAASMVVSIAQADPATESKPARLPDFKLPKGWTMEDLQACMAAGAPGEMHKKLANDIGTWTGKQTMWMGLDAEPAKSDCSSTVTPLMDGRFVKVDFSGEIPGMGPYRGMGIVGYDNVSKQFQAIWLDNCGTGMSVGNVELSPDGKTLTINYRFTCPLTKKPATMRQVETYKNPNSKTMEMFGTDPKSGKEYKMMSIELTKP